MDKFIVVFLLLLCFNSNAQVKRTIWGLTIGESSKREVMTTLEQKNITYKFLDNDNYVYGEESFNYTPLQFAGKIWSCVVFYFDINNKLGAISFIKNFNERSRDYSTDDCYNFFEEIHKMMDVKYKSDPKVKTQLEYDFGAQSYDVFDNRTKCNLSFDNREPIDFVKIIYVNLNSVFPLEEQKTHDDL